MLLERLGATSLVGDDRSFQAANMDTLRGSMYRIFILKLSRTHYVPISGLDPLLCVPLGNSWKETLGKRLSRSNNDRAESHFLFAVVTFGRPARTSHQLVGS